jgi:SAM-dependent methyltransferase
MMFPHLIRGIAPGARVLDIGPGNSPHPRADVLLEKRFEPDEAFEQRGKTSELKTNLPVVYFEGEELPFRDGEFDYAICSHVLEHVYDVPAFLSEVFRISKGGYFEFPTVYYEYCYNFTVHRQILHYEDGELRHMKKSKSGLNAFRPVQAMFYRSLEEGYTDQINDLKPLMFQGFEWQQPFSVREATMIGELVPKTFDVPVLSIGKKLFRRLQRKLGL